MKKEKLESLLLNKCKNLGLKTKAFKVLEKVFSVDSDNDGEDFWRGFEKKDLRLVFERFVFQVGNEHYEPLINTRIVIYVERENSIWLKNLEPIGYYEYLTDFDGEFHEDYFVIEKEFKDFK